MADWLAYVHAPQTELARRGQSVRWGVPFGAEVWAQETAAALGLEFTLRSRGRPHPPGVIGGGLVRWKRIGDVPRSLRFNRPLKEGTAIPHFDSYWPTEEVL